MSQRTEKTYRYPGVTPFTTEQANVFFGRKQDTDELFRLIKREPLVVLYGKSGLGKSSLINAGIVPECQKEKTYAPLIIRFGAWTEDTTLSPVEIIKNALLSSNKRSVLSRLIQSDDSLWKYAKEKQLSKEGKPLLIFDQFEELFSYPTQQIPEFQQEVSELLNTGIPLRFRRALEKIEDITDAEEEILEAPLEARIVFAIRSDRMHLMDRLTTYLPNVLRNCFELRALKREDAQNAIEAPARAEGSFKTQPFEYSGEAVTNLLRFLEDGQDKRVEGILLQMLCEHFERKQVEEKSKQFLDLQEIGDPNEVIKNYYEEKLGDLQDADRAAARLLIEEGLVSEGEAMRLSLHEAYIAQEYKIDKALLEKLVDCRLLRSEPFLRGGYTYELSHDRLIVPVIYSREIRRDVEQGIETNRLIEIAEKERKEKIKAQRNSRILAFLLLAALLAFFIAGYFWWLANNQKVEAINAKNDAVNARELANEKEMQAQEEKRRAEKALNDLQLERDRGTILEEKRKESETRANKEKERTELLLIFARIDRLPKPEIELGIVQLKTLLEKNEFPNHKKEIIEKINSLNKIKK
mgnify:CR=1 FL=1